MLRKRIVLPTILIPTFVATTALFPLQSLAEGDTVRAQNREEYQELLDARLTQAMERKQVAAERAEQIRQNISDRQLQVQERTEQSIETIKERLVSQIERTLEHFQTMIDRINNNKGLTDTAKAAAIAEVEGYMAQVENLKASVENAEMLEELKAISQEARELWQGYNQQHLGYIGLHMVGRFQDFLDRISETASKFEARLIYLEDTFPEIDLSEVKSALADYDLALLQAQAKVSNAEVVFGSINADNENNQSLYKEGIANLREAKGIIHTAYVALREAVVNAKQAVSELPETTREE